MVEKGLRVKDGADRRRYGLKERRTILKRRKVGREVPKKVKPVPSTVPKAQGRG